MLVVVLWWCVCVPSTSMQALLNTMTTASFNNLLAAYKKNFKMACADNAACTSMLIDKITAFIQQRLDEDAASDQYSKARSSFD
jgi:hypothetical protein